MAELKIQKHELKKSFSIAVTPSQYQRLIDLSKQQDCSRGELVVALMNYYEETKDAA